MRKLKGYKPTRFMAKGSRYDKDAADFAVAFIEQLCHTKGQKGHGGNRNLNSSIGKSESSVTSSVWLRKTATVSLTRHISRLARRTGRANLLPPLPFSFVAAMGKKERKFTDARRTGNKLESYSMLRQTWSECVLPSKSESKSSHLKNVWFTSQPIVFIKFYPPRHTPNMASTFMA